MLHHGRVHSPFDVTHPGPNSANKATPCSIQNRINLRISSKGSSSPDYLEILFCNLFSFFFLCSSKEKHLVAELPVHPQDEQCLRVCDTLAECHGDNSMPVHFNKLVINKRVSPLMFTGFASTLERTELMRSSSCELREASALFLLYSLH